MSDSDSEMEDRPPSPINKPKNPPAKDKGKAPASIFGGANNGNNNAGGEDLRKKEREAQQIESLPWVEKYRPKQFDELIAHGDILATLQKLIDQNRLPHLLLYGPPGTGKTSTILACARRMYGNNYQSMVLELNASDDRGIDVVREQIKDFASTRKIFSNGAKLVILDEADNMTQPAQAALRRVIEKFTRNTRFCMICNYVSKIIPALQSRCTKFRFGPLPKDPVAKRLEHIIATEKVDVTKDGLQALVKLGEGDMRKSLNILQATSMAYERVDEGNVYACTGNPRPQDIEKIVTVMLNEDFSEAYHGIMKVKTERGLALQDIIREVHSYVVRLDITPETMMRLLRDLSDVEARLAVGATEKIQLGAIIGSFQLARDHEASK